MVLLGVVFYMFNWRNNSLVEDMGTTQPVTIRTTTNNKNATRATMDVKFTGTIQAVDNQQPVDGDLRVKVNDMWIIIGGGEMILPNEEAVLIGFDSNVNPQTYVGKKAEVYAKKTDFDQILTILGGGKYYFKIIQ